MKEEVHPSPSDGILDRDVGVLSPPHANLKNGRGRREEAIRSSQSEKLTIPDLILSLLLLLFYLPPNSIISFRHYVKLIFHFIWVFVFDVPYTKLK